MIDPELDAAAHSIARRLRVRRRAHVGFEVVEGPNGGDLDRVLSARTRAYSVYLLAFRLPLPPDAVRMTRRLA